MNIGIAKNICKIRLLELNLKMWIDFFQISSVSFARPYDSMKVFLSTVQLQQLIN